MHDREWSLTLVDAAAPLMMVPVTATTDQGDVVALGAADTIEIELAGKYRLRVGIRRVPSAAPSSRNMAVIGTISLP
jgi:hypothetical protein